VKGEIDQFILYIATERGLSTAYQLSVRQSLDALVGWMEEKSISELNELGTEELSCFLSDQKKGGLSAESLRITMVHLTSFKC